MISCVHPFVLLIEENLKCINWVASSLYQTLWNSIIWFESWKENTDHPKEQSLYTDFIIYVQFFIDCLGAYHIRDYVYMVLQLANNFVFYLLCLSLCEFHKFHCQFCCCSFVKFLDYRNWRTVKARWQTWRISGTRLSVSLQQKQMKKLPLHSPDAAAVWWPSGVFGL